MKAANLDGLSCSGSNKDLNDPLCTALINGGFQMNDMSQATDADLVNLSTDSVNLVLDLAELRTLENCYGNLALVDITVGPRRENLAQIADQVEKAIIRQQTKIAKYWGIGNGSLSAGSIALNFSEGEDD